MNQKQKIDPSWHITGNHPTRECKPADRGDEACWLVSFPRGFEPLQIAVWGDGVHGWYACEAASEWLIKTHPNASSSSDEEDSTAKLLTSEERKSFQGTQKSSFAPPPPTVTPGPWMSNKHHSFGNDSFVITGANSELTPFICRVSADTPEDEANARLIAAAPELIATLTDAVEDAGFSLSGPTDHRVAEDGEPKWVCRAREVIAKAYAVPSKPARVAPPLPEPTPAKKTR